MEVLVQSRCKFRVKVAELCPKAIEKEFDALGYICQQFSSELASCTTSSNPAIAQLVEHLTVDCCSHQMVTGSIPVGRIYDSLALSVFCIIVAGLAYMRREPSEGKRITLARILFGLGK